MRTIPELRQIDYMNNGVIFYSTRHKGCITIATVDKQGNIQTKYTTIEKYQKPQEKHSNPVDKNFYFKSFIFSLLVSTGFLLLSIVKGFIYGFRFMLIWFILQFLFNLNRSKKKNEDVARFHSAGHMVINAYEKLGRVPSLKEICQSSRFYNLCEINATSIIFVVFPFSLLICTFVSNILYCIIALISINVLIIICMQLGFFNFIQLFNISKPTYKELLVVFEGIKVWDENEKKGRKI